MLPRRPSPTWMSTPHLVLSAETKGLRGLFLFSPSLVFWFFMRVLHVKEFAEFSLRTVSRRMIL